MAKVTVDMTVVLELRPEEAVALRQLLGNMSRMDYEQFVGKSGRASKVGEVFSVLDDALKRIY